MSKKRNDKRDLALKALVARYEAATSGQENLFLSQEEFDELLSHYYDSFDYDRTLQVADLAIEQHNFSPDFYKWKALIHKINLEEEEAFGALEKLSIYAPNDEEALMLRLEVLTHFERRELAREVLEQLQQRVTGNEKQSLLAFFDGLLLLQEFRYDESFQALCDAVRLDPSQEPALEELLNANELLGKRKYLRKLFDELLAQDPFNDLLWYYSGLWYDDDGREDDALEAFANARSLNSSNPAYDLEYADKLFDLDRYEEALKAYVAYFESDDAEESYETFMRVGRSYQLLGHLDQAKTAFFKAVELNGNAYDIFQHLGECFVAEEKWGVAAYNYGRAVEREGHTPDCWLGLALCHAATNEAEEAEFAFRKAIQMDDRFSDATVALAVFFVDQGRDAEAFALMAETMERYEDTSLAYGSVAINLMANRRKAAMHDLNKALSEYYEGHQILLDFFPDLRKDREINAIFELYKPREL
ncbi:tetratricopeptide repeat protein [Neolewinella persica]|uniref:tetratricopeptide repeat protein n=1 Tax=Neolewinella persica TaxID=70998 RepID=UPI000364D811|nr:tetratricopeptide repeat protein [Neolewinella persica]